jgi:hypothetical protein
MPQSARHEPDGRIVVEFDGCIPLVFTTPEEYAAWERAYLTCSMFNGTKTCFTKHPPACPTSSRQGKKIRFD